LSGSRFDASVYYFSVTPTPGFQSMDRQMRGEYRRLVVSESKNGRSAGYHYHNRTVKKLLSSGYQVFKKQV
jgi:hypothetical protein